MVRGCGFSLVRMLVEDVTCGVGNGQNNVVDGLVNGVRSQRLGREEAL